MTRDTIEGLLAGLGQIQARKSMINPATMKVADSLVAQWWRKKRWTEPQYELAQKLVNQLRSGELERLGREANQSALRTPKWRMQLGRYNQQKRRMA